MTILAGERCGVKLSDNLRRNGSCTLADVATRSCMAGKVDNRTRTIRRFIRCVCTSFPQILSIEFLPNFGDLFTDKKIEFNCFFDFFDGMNRCCVVFSTKLAGNFWKAKVKFAA